jgi:HPr kinase/phosphorylase
MRSKHEHDVPELTVADFVEKAPKELELKVLTGTKGLKARRISSERIQKLGLALAGFPHYIHAGRLQIVGQSETSYLAQLSPKGAENALANLDPERLTCILFTKDLEPSAALIAIALKNDLALLQTPLVSSKAISVVTNFLQEELAPTLTMHGVLLEMFGIGVMLIGESGIGKSECALDLVSRGHSLIADDSICVKKIGTRLVGEAPALTHGHMEIRGLGIVNIRDLFGVSSVGTRILIKLCIELKKWSSAAEIDRLGLDTQDHEIFGMNVAKFVLPVRQGRNLAILVETAVKIYLQKISGIDAARALIEKHDLIVGKQDILKNAAKG